MRYSSENYEKIYNGDLRKDNTRWGEEPRQELGIIFPERNVSEDPMILKIFERLICEANTV